MTDDGIAYIGFTVVMLGVLALIGWQMWLDR